MEAAESRKADFQTRVFDTHFEQRSNDTTSKEMDETQFWEVH